MLSPGTAWQQRDLNQANEDSFAVNPYYFTLVDSTKKYQLRCFKQDHRRGIDGYHGTGYEVEGDLKRAVAHRTLPH